MSAFVIDAFEFCRLKERLDGETAVADFPRLAEETVDKSGVLRWSLQGGSNLHGHPQMVLAVSGTVKLMCQRCLAPMSFAFENEAVLVLAADEGGADEIDALLNDESVEVIVGSKAFNIAEVIEDEALLVLPLSPKHETCPGQLVLPATKEAEKESPFAILKNLKQ
jgi:uncharacterized protein